MLALASTKLCIFFISLKVECSHFLFSVSESSRMTLDQDKQSYNYTQIKEEENTEPVNRV